MQRRGSRASICGPSLESSENSGSRQRFRAGRSFFRRDGRAQVLGGTHASMSPASPAPESAPSPSPQVGGFKKKNFVFIGLAFAALWALAISSGSIVFMSIAGVLTLLAAGLAFWAWRMVARHRKLAAVMQGAAESPEARRAALAALAADPKSGDVTNVLARAQLLAGDNPGAALALLEPLELKSVPPAMQDDMAVLKSQLLLAHGRAKEARPLADSVNLESPQRAEMRPVMVAIVAETWARTGSAAEANALLDSVDGAAVGDDLRAHLLIARAFARFAAAKKGAVRGALRELAAINPNLLGRFVAPQSKIHPGLQRLAREEAQRHGSLRQPSQHVGAGRRRRAR